MSSCLQVRTPSPCALQLLSPIQASTCAHPSTARSPLAPLQLNLEAAGGQFLSSLSGKLEASSGLLRPPGSSAPASLGLGTRLAMASGEATAGFATPTVEAEGRWACPSGAVSEVPSSLPRWEAQVVAGWGGAWTRGMHRPVAGSYDLGWLQHIITSCWLLQSWQHSWGGLWR